MTLKQQIKLDAVRTFLNTNEFAEWIKYTPKGGTVKNIKAIVDRPRIDPANETSNRMLTNELKIHIACDPTHGISNIIKDADTVLIKDFPNGSSREYMIKDILGSDDGMWYLLVQR